jgi:hypothetical protein
MTAARSIRLSDEEGTFADMRAAEKVACAERNVLAAKTVAEYAENAAECAELLAMLGLDLSELR